MLLGLSAATAVTGCGRGPRKSTGPVRQIKKKDLSAAEQKYGIAPIPDASVTYQPDVIVVGGGADSIRGQSKNGFIWTIDASAPRAAELTPGKIFFMTGRAVGRVLNIRKDGDSLVIVTGPVELTDIVKQADIQIAAVPIDFGEALAYETPELPRYTDMSVQTDMPEAHATPAMFVQTQATDDAPDVTSLVNFKTSPFANSQGLGMRVSSDGGGLKVTAQAYVHLARPTLDVVLKITPGGGVTEASVELRGAAGLTFQFAAGTDVGRRANVNGILEPNIDFSIPVGGIGPLPFSVTVRQRFVVTTSFGVRNSTISATGDYTFKGGFKVGYFGGKWDVGGPMGFSAKQSMLQSAGGISIAPTGINLTHQLRVIVGIGAAGFCVGPYFSFTSAIGLFKGSDLGMIACREATLVVSLRGGVGYSIPKVITNFINGLLRTLNIRYGIRGEGGLEPSQPLTIINSSGALKGCQADKA
jgi:hypothetical protein